MSCLGPVTCSRHEAKHTTAGMEVKDWLFVHILIELRVCIVSKMYVIFSYEDSIKMGWIFQKLYPRKGELVYVNFVYIIARQPVAAQLTCVSFQTAGRSVALKAMSHQHSSVDFSSFLLNLSSEFVRQSGSFPPASFRLVYISQSVYGAPFYHTA